jgi:hypothetical protein
MSRRVLQAAGWLGASICAGLMLGFLVGLARPRPRVLGPQRPVSAAEPEVH